MLRVLAATIATALLLPIAALAATAPAHGPSAVPLLVELAAVAAVVVLVRGRHAIADLVRGGAHQLAHPLVHRRDAHRAA